jgi:hypothetical protein
MVLHGAAGLVRTTLVKAGVLPLLRRRAGDHQFARGNELPVALPFPDRRGSYRTVGHRVEVAICFDAWNKTPLTALYAQILEALPIRHRCEVPPFSNLAESLAAWSKKLDARFLIVLDRFEEYLAAPITLSGIRRFADDFAQAVNEPLLPVNFLLSLPDEQALFGRFGKRIPSLGDQCLCLPRLHYSTAMPPHAAQTASVYASVIAVARPLTRVKVRETGRSEQAAARIVAEVPPTKRIPDPAAAQLSRRGHSAATTAVVVRRSPIDLARAKRTLVKWVQPGELGTPRGEQLSGVSISYRFEQPMLKWLAIPIVCISLLPAVWTTLRPSSDPQSAHISMRAAGNDEFVAMGTTTPHTSEVPSGLPKVGLVTDMASSTDVRIAGDLARLIAPDAGVELLVHADLSSGVTPVLAIVRYDALQSRRKGDTAAREPIDGLRIVTPLYTDEIYFIVRTDSPLAFIHDIRDARINLGPTQSSRGSTVALLYEQMFETSIPAASTTFFADEEALIKLVTDRTIDAMVVVAAQPAKWLVDLTPAMRQSIRLLKLDPEHPASRRAIQRYLPATIRAASYDARLREDTLTLAVMSFLVTSDYTDQAAVERLEMFARSLCRNLPVLRREGHPKWREVQPDLQLDVALHYSVPAETGFHSCWADNQVGNSVGSRR